MKCYTCNEEIIPIGCKVSNDPMYYCQNCGTLRFCDQPSYVVPLIAHEKYGKIRLIFTSECVLKLEDVGTDRGEACIMFEEKNKCILRYACPKCSKVREMLISFTGNTPGWELVEGDKSDPTTWTLVPSINHLDCCDWHGHLVKGVWTKC